MANVNSVKAYEKHFFQSASEVGADFKSLAGKLEEYIIELCKENGFKMVSFNSGHFDCSGYVQHVPTGRMVYWSIRDVRIANGEWYNRVLYRTAKKVGDCSGFNQYCPMDKLGDALTSAINIENKWSGQQLLAMGNEIASLWGGSCYGYWFDHEAEKVVFECIEHGEKFTTAQSYSEF